MNVFCNNWDLVINIDKSKIMTFSKSGRMPKHKFRYVVGGEEPEYVN